MERSRSKRPHYDYENDHNNNNKRYQSSSSYFSNRHHNPPGRLYKPSHNYYGDTATGTPHSHSICFRILCPDAKAGSVIGKGGSIISSLRRETGARINVQNLIQGDDERVIEVYETSYSSPSSRGRLEPETAGNSGSSSLSPAQEALLKIHARINDCSNNNENGNYEEEDQNRRITTRLVVPRNHVGCLLGKGGKIIEQMREETKTQIRILPRDQTLPRCVASTEEIVQVVGELNAVKKALRIISTRLKENPPRERGQPPPHGRTYSPEHRSLPDDDGVQYGNIMSRRASFDGGSMPGMRSSVAFTGSRNSSQHPRPSVYTSSDDYPSHESHYERSSYDEELVFRILCPNEKIGSVIGEDGGIIKRLREDIGVNIKVTDPVPGSDERIIIISANEVPDDDLFPAQEALLHIQSCIVDLGPDKDGVITTKLLVPSNEIGCLHGKGGSILSEMRRQTRANIQILPREFLPSCALGADEVVQIVGDIQVAREALMQVTSRLRRNLHRELSFPGHMSMSCMSSLDHPDNSFEPSSPGRSISPSPAFRGSGHFSSNYQNLSPSPDPSPTKDADGGWRSPDTKERAAQDSALVRLGRSAGGVVTKTTVEVVIPEYAIAALIRKSENNIAQISEMSGAIVNLLEVRPGFDKVVEISGSPDQTHTAQSLLQAFILKAQELEAQS
uniref:K Homology domain-containing protein n=1 Tax=Araucaria cunninghamii TaxID=56994 RepID=A0A0D6QZI0_ARACU